MGMFDYIVIDSAKLPVSTGEKEILKNKVFQTKNLENCLLSYKITNENELMRMNIILENSSESAAFFRDMSDEEKLPDSEIIYKKVPFHGLIRFYTSVDNIWYEFHAKFTDDKLVSIERIKRD